MYVPFYRSTLLSVGISVLNIFHDFSILMFLIIAADYVHDPVFLSEKTLFSDMKNR